MSTASEECLKSRHQRQTRFLADVSTECFPHLHIPMTLGTNTSLPHSLTTWCINQQHPDNGQCQQRRMTSVVYFKFSLGAAYFFSSTTLSGFICVITRDYQEENKYLCSCKLTGHWFLLIMDGFRALCHNFPT